jgi:hypothetical protein
VGTRELRRQLVIRTVASSLKSYKNLFVTYFDIHTLVRNSNILIQDVSSARHDVSRFVVHLHFYLYSRPISVDACIVQKDRRYVAVIHNAARQ